MLPVPRAPHPSGMAIAPPPRNPRARGAPLEPPADTRHPAYMHACIYAIRETRVLRTLTPRPHDVPQCLHQLPLHHAPLVVPPLEVPAGAIAAEAASSSSGDAQFHRSLGPGPHPRALLTQLYGKTRHPGPCGKAVAGPLPPMSPSPDLPPVLSSPGAIPNPCARSSLALSHGPSNTQPHAIHACPASHPRMPCTPPHLVRSPPSPSPI